MQNFRDLGIVAIRHFRDPPVRTKFVLTVTVCAGVAAILCCIGLVLHDGRMLRAARIDRMEIQATQLGLNCATAMADNDRARTQQLLASLQSDPSVEQACLHDTRGDLVAVYLAENVQTDENTRQDTNARENASRLALRRPVGSRFTSTGSLEWFQPVVDGQETVGSLYLEVNLDDVRHRLGNHFWIAVTMALASMVAAAILAGLLHPILFRPLSELVEASEQIVHQEDFSCRVGRSSRDEFDTVAEAFNRILDQIEDSNRASRDADKRTTRMEDEIARRKLVQVELEHARDLAVKANRVKSEFLADMSHEIRTPLNGILGFSELLLRGMDEGKEEVRREYFQTIHASGEHLLNLINDILDLSKIEADRLEIHKEPCSPHGLVNEVIAVLQPKAREKGISLDCQWDGGLPHVIDTDPARFRQLLMNLLGNAIKFTETGGVRVVTRLLGDRAEPQIQIEVIDTGVGIAADSLDAIFDPFVQADRSGERRVGGTGLGLSISRRIARVLGGDVTVRSQLGTGSTFTVTVATGPLDGIAILEAPATNALTERRKRLEQMLAEIPEAKILLVDDGDTNRRLISLILHRAGADVAMAEDGRAGVELAMAEPFDLILMDMQMPVMDGYEATRRIRQSGLTTPIIALTANAMKGDEQKCREAGCTGYLTKPIDTDQLMRTVATELVSRSRPASGQQVPMSPPAPETSEPRQAAPSILPSTPAPESPLGCELPMDDPEIREIVEEFIVDLREKMRQMHQAFRKKDFDELASAAHWLKGAGGTVGFPAFTPHAARLEDAAKKRALLDAAVVLAELDELTSRIILPAIKSSC